MGAFQDNGSGGILPERLERTIENGATNDEHDFSSRARPAHTRTGQVSLELLDAALDRAGADGKPIISKLMVLHTALVGLEVVSVVGQVCL
jgi:hypothetical protein